MSTGAASSRAGGTPIGGCRALGGDELLAASGIGKRFGRKLVLEDAALSARSGEAVAIVGENGAGKSTLLRICAGLDRPDRGTVTAQGQIGYCPQDPGLFDLLDELVVCAPLDGPPMVHHEDVIGDKHHREAVRDHERGPVVEQLVQRGLPRTDCPRMQENASAPRRQFGRE